MKGTTFSQSEKYAIINMLSMIMEADTIIHPKEIEYMDSILADFAITTDDNERMENMNLQQCIAIIKNMPKDKKEITKKIFTAMAIADGYIDPREIELFESI
jgi:uncharacterized tellurite resistance protein B-like protein